MRLHQQMSVITYQDRTWIGHIIRARGVGDVLVDIMMSPADAWSLREATVDRHGSHAMRVDWPDHDWHLDGIFIELELTDEGEAACVVHLRLSGKVTTL